MLLFCMNYTVHFLKFMLLLRISIVVEVLTQLAAVSVDLYSLFMGNTDVLKDTKLVMPAVGSFL